MESSRVILFGVLLSGCGAAVPPPLLGTSMTPAGSAARERVIRFASETNDRQPLEVGGIAFDSDPVGFVRAAYWSARVDVFDFQAAKNVSASGIEILVESAQTRRLPIENIRSGDLAAIETRDGGLFPAIVLDAQAKTVTVRGWFANGPVTTTLQTGDVVLAWDPFG